MKNNEFKALINNVTDKVARAYAAADCDKLTQVGDYLYDYRKENPERFTARQNEIVEDIFGDINAKIAELDSEFYEVDDREEPNFDNRVPDEEVRFTESEWEEFYGNAVVSFCKLETVEDCEKLIALHHTLYDGARALSDEMRAQLEEIGHNRIKALNRKGGKHMSNKKNNKADNKPAQTTEAPVEVLKGEVIDTKNEVEINAAIDRIASKVENIGKGYLDIVGDVARLRKYEAWKLTGHKSLYALCADKFGMARGTVANLEAVFKKYGDPETFTLTDACAGMSLRAMLAEIDAEKRAALEDKNGTPAEDGGDGEAPADNKKKGKVETLVSITWELAGDDWNTDAILEQIAKQLANNPDAKEAFPDGACVTFTITK